MRFISADAIFTGTGLLRDHVLAMDGGTVADIIPSAEIERARVERFEGVLSPGFVNAHLHLELSHLAGRIPRGTGLPEFGRQVTTLRGGVPEGARLEHMQEADRAMRAAGIVAAGDISNSQESLAVKAASPLRYHTFIELLALHPERAEAVMAHGKSILVAFERQGCAASLSPHAPYTVSPQLMRAIASEAAAGSGPLSMHSQESADEASFLRDGTGPFRALYEALGIDIGWYRGRGKSGLSAYAEDLPRCALLVHNTVATARDVERGRQLGARWVFCPAANEYITGSLPDFSLFKKDLENCLIGTDSLASNGSLDVMAEANILLANSDLTVADVLRFCTYNAAQALGFTDLGSIAAGFAPGINLVQVEGRHIRFRQRIL